MEVVDGHSVVGWRGFLFTNMPQWQEYQLAIVLSSYAAGGTQFTCCARPRFSTAILGAQKSQELVGSLQSEVVNLTGSA